MNSRNRPQSPKPGSQLYESLFVGLDHEQTLVRISEGIKAAITNAGRLLGDVEVLIKSERHASARFLLTTADEEMAKPYILLDMCRLDFSKHENALRNLCRAFYDHVAKHAYNKIIRFVGPLNDMKRVKELWMLDTTRWWEAGYESEEPDMPHETYFERELPLYVDFIEYDGKWHVPDDASLEWVFHRIIGEDPFSESKKEHCKLNEAVEKELFTQDILVVLNATSKSTFFDEHAETETIIQMYEKFRNLLPQGIRDHFADSPLDQWPLYSFSHILR